MRKSRLIALLQSLEGNPDIRVMSTEPSGTFQLVFAVRQWNNGPIRTAYVVAEKVSLEAFPEAGCPIVKVRRKPRAKKNA